MSLLSATSAQARTQTELHILVLAAGAGKRMHSDLPKVLQPLGGLAMVEHVLNTARQLEPAAVHVVYGHQGERVQHALAAWCEQAQSDGLSVFWARQQQQRGTGDAVSAGLANVPDQARVLVLYGDAPLIPLADLETLSSLETPLAVLGTRVDDPSGYGRLVRDSQGQLQAIVEDKDANTSQRAISEINTGVIYARAADLRRWLSQLQPNNAQGEFLLTDVVALAVAEAVPVTLSISSDASACLGANDRWQLAQLEQKLQWQRRQALLRAGVSMADPALVQIRGTLHHGRDVFLDINVVLEGENRLGDGVVIGPGCVLKNVELAAGTRVHAHSVLEGARSTGACEIGPFARLRPGSELAAGAKVGNFVEMKKSRLGPGSKASHLTYLGDAVIGAQVNIGAGTITCNYDGVNKFQTTIEDAAFIGSNSALVAPLTVGAGALVGAGSVVTQNVPAEHLAVARTRQKNLPRRRKKSASKVGE